MFLMSGKYPLGCSSMCWLSWFSVPGFGSCPGFHLGLGASKCPPLLAFCFTGPLDIAWICCPQLPYHPCKNGTHSTCLYSTGGHTPMMGGRVKVRGLFYGNHAEEVWTNHLYRTTQTPNVPLWSLYQTRRSPRASNIMHEPSLPFASHRV